MASEFVLSLSHIEGERELRASFCISEEMMAHSRQDVLEVALNKLRAQIADARSKGEQHESGHLQE